MAQASRKARNRSAVRHSQPLPGWPWLLIGLTIGLGVAAFFFFFTRPHTALAPTPTAPTAASPPKPSDKKDATKPSFDFYTILPEMEVGVPEAQKNARPSAKPGVYLLQVASFRNFADADGMKARLALLGVESKIETVTGSDNEAWHRVRVGPYSDPRELNRIRTRLLNNNISAIMIQLKYGKTPMRGGDWLIP